MKLVDTHCHIDLYPNYREVIQAVEKKQIYTIAVTNAPSVFRHSSSLTKNSKFIRTAIGFHPELVAQREQEINLFLQMLTETKYVGEIGLDYVTKDEDDRSVQRKVFQKILTQCAEQKHKILTIHSRRAANDVIDMIGENFPCIVILHWFLGSKTALEKGLRFGFYFSVNSAMLHSTSGLNIVHTIPEDRLLTESDGPFISISGKPATPVNMNDIIQQLSRLRQSSSTAIADMVFENFHRILKLTDNLS
jgi:TatD DNase family protein